MRGDELLPAPGRIVGGKYRLERVIESSARATVFEAAQADSVERVAIKILQADAVRAGGGLPSLLQEAATFAHVEHPHVVRLLDFGEHDGSLFLVMPLVEGVTLREALAGRALELGPALELLSQIAAGTAAGHGAGTLHHALNPDSILMTAATGGSSGAPKIIGFVGGRALSSGGQTFGIEKLSPMATSYPFVAPELLLCQGQADVRADVYSLAAIAFTVLTGRLPYNAQNPVDLALLLMRSEPPSIDELRPGLPAALAAAVARALSRKPHDRFASAKDLNEALLAGARAAAPRAGASSRPRAAVAAELSEQQAKSFPSKRPALSVDDEFERSVLTQHKRSVRSLYWVVAAACLVGLASVVGARLFGAPEPTARAPEALPLPQAERSALPADLRSPEREPPASTPAAKPEQGQSARAALNDWESAAPTTAIPAGHAAVPRVQSASSGKTRAVRSLDPERDVTRVGSRAGSRNEDAPVEQRMNLEEF